MTAVTGLTMNFRIAVVLSVLSAAFAAPISHDEIVENSSRGLRLLNLIEGAVPEWKTEDQVFELLRNGTRFVSEHNN